MKTPKISVIIPVYNVEKYLHQCIDSVIHQTYRNLEIIVVDDGSTDNCSKICDDYANNDKRIKVVHKENGGVSSARNTGLALATGDWIGWLDSDDWVEPDMYEYLLKNAILYDSDVSICSQYEYYKNCRRIIGWDQIKVLNTEKALELLMKNDNMQNILWDKLWKRTLFEDITFPVGRTYEDLAVIYRLFEKAEKLVCLPKPKYNHRQRTGSIMADISLANRINHYISSKERCEEFQTRWPQFRPYLEGQCVAAAIGIWSVYLLNPVKERKIHRAILLEISEFSKKHYRSALQNINLGITGRIVVRLTPYTGIWAFAISTFCIKISELKFMKE